MPTPASAISSTEIQNIPFWEKWVRTAYELKKVKKIYVTGSSSKLLSKEFGTALSGRYLDIEVHHKWQKDRFSGIDLAIDFSCLIYLITYKAPPNTPASWPGLDPAIQPVIKVVHTSLDYPVGPGNDLGGR